MPDQVRREEREKIYMLSYGVPSISELTDSMLREQQDVIHSLPMDITDKPFTAAHGAVCQFPECGTGKPAVHSVCTGYGREVDMCAFHSPYDAISATSALEDNDNESFEVSGR